MGLKRNWTPAAVLLLTLPCIGSGCLGGRRVSLADELSEARFERDRARVSLRQTLGAERQAAAGARAAVEEKESVLSESSQKDSAIRYLAEQVRKLTAERADVDRALAEARETEKRVRDNHSKLLDAAATSTEELSDLRQRAEVAAAEKGRLAGENQGLQKQLEASVRELDDLKAELTRAKAVVRSLQEQSPSAQGNPAVELALRARIEELERSLQKASPAAPASVEDRAPAAVSVLPGPAPEPTDVEAEPSSVALAFLALLEARGRDLLRGEFRGDAFDWSVIGTAGGLVLFFGLFWLVLRSRRKLCRQLSRSRAWASRNDAPAEPGQPAATGGKASSAEEPSPKAPPRRSTYVPPREDRDFSAIIASPRAAKKPERPARSGEAAEESSRERSKPSSPVAQAPVDARPASGRDESDEDSEGSEDSPHEDELENTQIISPMNMKELTAGKRKPPAPPPAAESSEGEDKELLDELRNVINKKFDELMK